MTDSAATPSGESTGWSARRSDERLVKRAKKGDRRAIEAIYERYHQDLYRFCLSLVGNRQDAEDALQGTMVKLIRSLPGEQRKIQLRPWIYRIARNESIDTIRRRRATAPIGPRRSPQSRRWRRRSRLASTCAACSRTSASFPSGSGGTRDERARRPRVRRDRVRPGDVRRRGATGRLRGPGQSPAHGSGSEMRCEQVVWELSEADGRVRNRREIQAHIRACAECRAFGEAISRRSGEFKALAPLPIAASAALLQGVLGAMPARRVEVRERAGAGAGKALRLGRRQGCGNVRGGGRDRDDAADGRADPRPARRRSGPGRESSSRHRVQKAIGGVPSGDGAEGPGSAGIVPRPPTPPGARPRRPTAAAAAGPH